MSRCKFCCFTCMQGQGATCTVRYTVAIVTAKKNPSGIRFFSFPSGKSVAKQQRRKVWVEFCKRKKFNPSSCSRICSRHFTEDAYEKGHSPQFLEQIECKEAFRVRLRSDALPTLNKPLVEASSSKLRTSTARRQPEKVSRVLDR